MRCLVRVLPISCCAVCLIFLSPTTFPQSKNEEACNKNMTFCWYGPYQDGSDEVDAWGNQWKTDDPTEKSLNQVTEVRCIKRLHVCIKARNQQTFRGGSLTNIDLYNVRSWSDVKVQAIFDESADPQCEQDTLVLNRVERSAIIINNPGPRGNEKGCLALMGPPKTVVYRLTD